MKIEIRADNSVHIEGYVNAVERDSNIINVPSVGRCVEQIRAGAFGQSLRSGADVAILENHDISRRLGSTSQGNLTLCEDNIGLRASTDITDEDIAGKARRGELRGWSFGFVCTDSEIEQRAGNVPRRIVKGLSLSEVSLIDGAYKPCYNGTLVEVRSEGNFMEYRSGVDEATEIIVEERAEDVDYSYYDALLRYCELRYNPYHDPGNGRFCSGGGAGGSYGDSILYVPNKKKGELGANGDGSSFYKIDQKFFENQLTNQSSSGTINSIEDCKNFDDLEKYLSEKYSITLREDVKSLDFESVKKGMTGFEKVAADYPEIAENLSYVQTTSRGEVASTNGIRLNFGTAYYSNPDTFKSAMENGMSSGWYAIRSERNQADNIAHEAGHMVVNAIIDYKYGKSTPIEKYQSAQDWNNGDTSNSILSKSLKEAKKTPEFKGKRNADILRNYSGYVSQSKSRAQGHEAIAEAFSDYYKNGESANPLSVIIVNNTKQAYDNVKKGRAI